MDDVEPWNPDSMLPLLGLAGLIAGYHDMTGPDEPKDPKAIKLRLMLIAAVLVDVFDLATHGLAWASVIHFVVKHLGAYQLCRMVAWIGTVAGQVGFAAVREWRENADRKS